MSLLVCYKSSLWQKEIYPTSINLWLVVSQVKGGAFWSFKESYNYRKSCLAENIKSMFFLFMYIKKLFLFFLVICFCLFIRIGLDNIIMGIRQWKQFNLSPNQLGVIWFSSEASSLIQVFFKQKRTLNNILFIKNANPMTI